MPEENDQRNNAYRRRNTASFFNDDEDKARNSKSPSNSSRSTPGKLAQEIYNEFLICKICLESYKNPKSLACLHTFCEECIENHVSSEVTYKKYSDYQNFTCPLCRKRTQLPLGGVKKLPDNFLVSSLSEMVGRQKSSSTNSYCDICKMVSKKQKEACNKCLECNKLLCKSCVEQHQDTKVTKDHSIIDVEIEKDVICKEHEDEVVRYYCEPCESCICVLCTFNEHADHEVTHFSEAVSKYKSQIENMLNLCKNQVEAYEKSVKQIDRASDIIKETTQEIRDHAIGIISEVRQKEKKLIEEIENIYGSSAIGLIERKSDLRSEFEELKEACNLTEVVLNGKDIELLLLKQNIQQKLHLLSKATSQNVPNSMKKNIKFVPGKTDLGSIQDLDEAFVTETRFSRSRGYYGEQTHQVLIKDASSQTHEDDNSSCSSIKSASSTTPQGLPPMFDVLCQTPIINQADIALSTDDLVTMLDKCVNTRARGLGQPTNEDRPSTRQRRRARESAPPPERRSFDQTVGDNSSSSSVSTGRGSATDITSHFHSQELSNLQEVTNQDELYNNSSDFVTESDVSISGKQSSLSQYVDQNESNLSEESEDIAYVNYELSDKADCDTKCTDEEHCGYIEASYDVYCQHEIEL